MKRILAPFGMIVILNCSVSPALADSVSFTPSAEVSDQGSVSGNAELKSIGTLHMSEGKVVINQNQIMVLSDSSDSPKDAELVGSIVTAHPTPDSAGRSISGTAVFTKGFSLPALDDFKIQDSVRASDGSESIGRIVDVTPRSLRIQTSQGSRIIPTNQITQISSPRAFEFTLPLAPGAASEPSSIVPQPSPAPLATAATSSTGVSPSHSISAAPLMSQMPVMNFRPTYTADPNNPPERKTKTYQAQLTERHVSKHVYKVAALTAGTIGCFAFPTAMAVICRRPGAFH